MQMRLDQQSHQPVEIWLRGNIDPSDIEILWREAHRILAEDCVAVWLYLEQIPRLDYEALQFLKDFANLCHQNQVSFSCIVHQNGLYQALLQHKIPVQRHDPERKSHKAHVY